MQVDFSIRGIISKCLKHTVFECPRIVDSLLGATVGLAKHSNVEMLIHISEHVSRFFNTRNNIEMSETFCFRAS